MTTGMYVLQNPDLEATTYFLKAHFKKSFIYVK